MNNPEYYNSVPYDHSLGISTMNQVIHIILSLFSHKTWGEHASGGSAPPPAWFKKCHFQVTPEIDRALMVKGFLVLGVTLI